MRIVYIEETGGEESLFLKENKKNKKVLDKQI